MDIPIISPSIVGYIPNWIGDPGEEQALSALSQILIRCSAYRYDVLEVFSVGEVFLAQPGTKKTCDIQK